MPKSKNRKNHKKKVQHRNKIIAEQKNKMQKMQKQFLMDLIKREQEKGAFDNTDAVGDTSSVTDAILNGPQIEIETPQGPQI